MSERHDIHLAGSTASVVGMMAAGGPVGFVACIGLMTLCGLSLFVLAEPGKTFAGACVLILPIVAWRVARVPAGTGGLDKGRLAAACALLLGAVLAYQAEWGTLGDAIEAGKAERCAYNNIYNFGMDGQATSWFLDCRGHLTAEQKRQACARLRSYPWTNTLRLNLVCQ